MRVTNLTVTKLFGVFDHDIALNLSDRITIVHGPNGYGKTSLLILLQALLGCQLAKLRKTSFETFTVTLDNGQIISVSRQISKKEADKEKGTVTLRITLKEPSGESQEYAYEGINRAEARELGYPIEYFERHIPDLDRVGPDSWIQSSSGRQMDFEDVIEKYGHQLPTRMARSRKPIPEWLVAVSKKFDVRLIEAQRLLSWPDGRRASRPDETTTLEPSVSSYSKELAASIQEIQARYGTSSQQLDSTFPSRVIQIGAYAASLNEDDLKNRLKHLEQQRQRIIAAGLLTVEHNYTPIFDSKQSIEPTTKNILSLYSSDVEKKLSVFTEITEKIELFKELINKRFSYKRLDVEGQSGFRLESLNGGSLLPSDLSSGEQHELVLLYELLFKTKPNALILIDEPELSLHVAWQVEFLKDLSRVIKLSSFDVILATHSPQIINDRWDLTIELKGP